MQMGGVLESGQGTVPFGLGTADNSFLFFLFFPRDFHPWHFQALPFPVCHCVTENAHPQPLLFPHPHAQHTPNVSPPARHLKPVPLPPKQALPVCVFPMLRESFPQQPHPRPQSSFRLSGFLFDLDSQTTTSTNKQKKL